MTLLSLIDRSSEKRGTSAQPLAASHSRRRNPGQPALISEPLPPERARGLQPLALQLAFDSLLEPAPAGQRGTSSGERHLVYMCRDYAVDVHLEGRDRGGPVVHGELLSRCAGPISEVPAFLLDGDQIAGYDCTGERGEFRLEAAATPDLRLCLLLDAEHCIDLPISLSGATAGRGV